jgi:NADH dehydrogenase
MRIVVTGAFGYSGRQIAERLLQAGYEVATLTNKLRPGEGALERVRAGPLCFDEPDRLASFMQGSEVLVNTYWERENREALGHGYHSELARRRPSGRVGSC